MRRNEKEGKFFKNLKEHPKECLAIPVVNALTVRSDAPVDVLCGEDTDTVPVSSVVNINSVVSNSVKACKMGHDERLKYTANRQAMSMYGFGL